MSRVEPPPPEHEGWFALDAHNTEFVLHDAPPQARVRTRAPVLAPDGREIVGMPRLSAEFEIELAPHPLWDGYTVSIPLDRAGARSLRDVLSSALDSTRSNEETT